MTHLFHLSLVAGLVWASGVLANSEWLVTFRPVVVDGKLLEAQFLHRRILHAQGRDDEASEKALLKVRRAMHFGTIPPLEFYADSGPALFRERSGVRAPLLDDLDFQQRTPISSSAYPLHDIWNAETWKFQQFADRGYLVPGRDDAVINSVFEDEALHLHDDILLLWSWREPAGITEHGVQPVLLGIVAVDRLSPFAEATHLLEDRSGIELEKLSPEPLREDSATSFYPPHWAAYLSAAGTKVYQRDTLQVNSLVTQRDTTGRTLTLLYALAYSHGLFSVGRVIPDGCEIKFPDGTKILGPAILRPTHLVAEGLGSRTALWHRMGFEDINVDTRGGPDLGLSIVGAEWPHFTAMLPYYLQSRGQTFDLETMVRLGPLWYRRIPEVQRPLPKEMKSPASAVAQLAFGHCATQLFRHSKPGSGNEFSLKARVRL